MMKILRHTVCMALLAPSLASAQSTENVRSEEARLFPTKVSGAGLLGNRSVSMGDRTRHDKEKPGTLPKTTGIPASLTHTKEYYLILNEMQFHYQNLKAGRIDKDAFLDEVKSKKWQLADTARLSPTPLTCGVAVVSGLDENGVPVYLVDANQNGDFSDDVIIPIPQRFGRPATVPIRLEYLENGETAAEEVAIGIGRSSNPDSTAISFSNPEFRYLCFSFNGKSYFLCTEATGLTNRPSVAVIPNRPYFEPVPAGALVEIGGYVNLDGHLFTLSEHRNNGREIVLSGARASLITPEGTDGPEPAPTLPSPSDTAPIVASQAGFKAPEIAGLDVVSQKPFSLKDLKGKWVYVDFWSTTCVPCIEELPLLKELYNRLNPEEVTFLGVVTEYGQGSLKRIMDEHGLPWTTIQSGSANSNTEGYDIYSFPTTFLIDPDGVIRHKNIRAKGLEAKIRELLR